VTSFHNNLLWLVYCCHRLASCTVTAISIICFSHLRNRSQEKCPLQWDHFIVRISVLRSETNRIVCEACGFIYIRFALRLNGYYFMCIIFQSFCVRFWSLYVINLTLSTVCWTTPTFETDDVLRPTLWDSKGKYDESAWALNIKSDSPIVSSQLADIYLISSS
jgi:hypothetical protein